jgi:hypothetical protein
MHQVTSILSSQRPVDIVQSINKALTHRKLKSYVEKQALDNENTPEEKLMYATTEAQDTLLTATAVFPFELFPDTIHLDREKLTIIHSSFFRTGNTTSMQIRDILSVRGNVGPFFGNIILSTKYFNTSTQTVKFLRRRDVLKFQRLIQGSIIAHHRQIDCTNIESGQLVALLSDLGQGTGSKIESTEI